MRTDLSGNPSFLEVLRRVREVVLEAYTHQDLPFEEIVKVVQPERTKKGSPLFQILFDLHLPLPVSELSALSGASLSVSELSSLTLSPLEVEFAWTVKFDLVVIITDTQQGMNVLMQYNTDLFNADTTALMLEQFKILLGSIVRQPTKRIGALELFTVNERRKWAMDQKARKEYYFKHIKNIQPKAINLQQTTMVTLETLRPGTRLPLVIRPAVDDIDVAGWVQTNLEFVEKELLEHGAILFQGFNVSTVPMFEQFAQAMCQKLFSENGEHPRENISGNVYTPTFYPKEKHLLWHNENSFNYQWPMKIWFGCVKPAECGGETPVVDSRKMFELIDPKIRERFHQKNILYVRNYRKGLGLSWQEVFRTTSRAAVEEMCRKDLIDFEWKGDDCLMTRSVRPAVAKHPKTGEWSWFNQAQHWHISCLDSVTRASLQSLFHIEDMPRNCYYGDGSLIEDSVIDEICALYRQLEVVFPWRKGDVLLLDNMLTAHARNPYVGERKILVAMGEMFSQHILDKEVSNG
jgi:alpha-ketoglutarate-dependent taurine dioxygenase